MKQLTMIVALLFAGIATADDHVDPATKAIYDRSCGFCHVSGAAGAPKTGDAAAWESRMALGMDAMVLSVKNGKGAMPPRGMCMDCTDEQFADLITYMAKAK
ncbi:MAG: c-type cytochrome [Proteobacteria bacterium]|nr:c-type cytochrome [Pseudomonadota bacterium]